MLLRISGQNVKISSDIKTYVAQKATNLAKYYHNLDNPHKQGTIYGAVLALCAMYLVVVFNNLQIITFLLSHLK